MTTFKIHERTTYLAIGVTVDTLVEITSRRRKWLVKEKDQPGYVREFEKKTELDDFLQTLFNLKNPNK